MARVRNDATFAARVRAAIASVIGAERAKLITPHSWRVWLASSLRMCGASDARIQAMGRWLNPESIKIYARMTTKEYALWVDKLMGVRRIDTARTTNLPCMDAADSIAQWGVDLRAMEPQAVVDDAAWAEKPKAEADLDPCPLSAGDRVEVYWTELETWYAGTFTSSAVRDSDDGGKQREYRVVYDAVGAWARCSARELTYWHCLDDELWRMK